MQSLARRFASVKRAIAQNAIIKSPAPYSAEWSLSIGLFRTDNAKRVSRKNKLTLFNCPAHVRAGSSTRPSPHNLAESLFAYDGVFAGMASGSIDVQGSLFHTGDDSLRQHVALMRARAARATVPQFLSGRTGTAIAYPGRRSTRTRYRRRPWKKSAARQSRSIAIPAKS